MGPQKLIYQCCGHPTIVGCDIEIWQNTFGVTMLAFFESFQAQQHGSEDEPPPGKTALSQFATEETRKLGRVNFRKDFWDCYWGQGK